MQRARELLSDVETAAYAMAAAAERRDIHPECRFNGFRSLLAAYVRCLQHLQETLLLCTSDRESFFFRADNVYERIEDYGVRMSTAFYTLFSAARVVDEELPADKIFVHPDENKRAQEVVDIAERSVACTSLPLLSRLAFLALGCRPCRRHPHSPPSPVSPRADPGSAWTFPVFSALGAAFSTAAISSR